MDKVFDRRQQLLDAALEEFSQRSFDEASINQILKNAGISKGVFYYHFKDKEALYMCLMEEASGVKWRFISEELQNQDNGFGDIFELFRMQAQAGIRFAQQYPIYHQFARILAREKNPVIRAHIDAEFAQSDKLEKMVEQAIKQGDFSPVYSKKFLIALIGFLFAHFDDVFPNERDAYESLDSYIFMMENGLGRK